MMPDAFTISASGIIGFLFSGREVGPPYRNVCQLVDCLCMNGLMSELLLQTSCLSLQDFDICTLYTYYRSLSIDPSLMP